MAKCKDCGRVFGTDQALKAHMGYCKKRKQKQETKPAQESKVLVPQPQENPEAVAEAASQGVPVEDVCSNIAADVEEASTEAPADAEAASPNGDETGRLERIRQLLAQGHTVKDLINPPFEFSESSVYEQAAKVFPPTGKAKEEEGKSDGGWPPAVYKKDQITNPDILLFKSIDGSDESLVEFRGMLKLRAAMLMVMDLVNIQKGQAEADAKRLDPLLKVLREGREELDAAAARAKSSSYEIALQAADEVAQGMKGAFSAEMRDLKAAIPGQPAQMNPLAQTFFNVMQPFAGQAIARLFSSIFPGMQGAQQAMEMLGQAQPAQPGQAQPAQPAHPEKLIWAPGEEEQWTEV